MSYMEVGGPGSSRPGGAVDLLVAEAAAARGLRRLEEVARSLAAIGPGHREEAFHGLACRVRAMVIQEGLSPDPRGGDVDLASTLDRLATLQLADSAGGGGEMVTSFPPIVVDRTAARAVLEAVREMLHVAEEMCCGFAGRRMLMAGEMDEEGLTVSFAVREVEPGVAGAFATRASWRRACLILRAFGGRPVRGFRDGMLVVGLFVPGDGLAGGFA